MCTSSCPPLLYTFSVMYFVPLLKCKHCGSTILEYEFTLQYFSSTWAVCERVGIGLTRYGKSSMQCSLISLQTHKRRNVIHRTGIDWHYDIRRINNWHILRYILLIAQLQPNNVRFRSKKFFLYKVDYC